MAWRCPACLSIYKNIFPQKMGKSKFLNTQRGGTGNPLQPSGSWDLLTNHLDGPASESQGLEFSMSYFILGFQLKALATRLKDRQGRPSCWWFGNVVGAWLKREAKGWKSSDSSEWLGWLSLADSIDTSSYCSVLMTVVAFCFGWVCLFLFSP